MLIRPGAVGRTGAGAQRSSLWNPGMLSGLALWLDAFDRETVTVSGQVSQWADKSGNARHMTVPAGSAGPSYSWTGLNSLLPALTFNGTTHILTVNSAPFYAAGQATWYFVLRAPSVVTGRLLFNEASVNATAPVYGMRAGISTASSLACLLRNDANTALVNNTVLQTSVFGASVAIVGVIDSGTALTVRLNGTAGSPTAYTRSGVLTLTRTALGALGGGTPSQYFPFECAEVIGLTRAVVSTEAERLEGNLAYKWQQSALPSNHPYKSVAP